MDELYVNIYSNMAQSFFFMEMYEDVLECSDMALSYDPTNVKAKLRRAKALVRLHMFDEAKKQLDELDQKLTK